MTLTNMTSAYDLHDSLGYQITLFSRISERRFEAALAPLGLSRVTWCVLLGVGQQGLKSPSEIADFVGIDRTATSRALRRLERDGQITRSNGQKDRRMTEVAITPQGAERLKVATARARENADYFKQKLSWYEQETLSLIIRKLMQGEARDVSGL